MISTTPMFARRLRTGALALLICTAGTATAVTTAQGRSSADDGTAGTTTGTPRAPLITEIEVDSLPGGKLRLRTEVAARGASVTSVRIRYRGVSYKATRTLAKRWSRTVGARGGDARNSVITLKVTACSGARCSSKTGSDAA
ncbi:MAG: hypothetical protein QOE11_2698 [Solirubrobacteraceae bacterium]|jgi:hypothetical protein|nr:hypothetical protein [Solirubrobacteraceae bacterium]